jgi:hypothetical protein
MQALVSLLRDFDARKAIADTCPRFGNSPGRGGSAARASISSPTSP